MPRPELPHIGTSGASYCLLHPRDTARAAKVAAFRSWIVTEADAASRPVATRGGDDAARGEG